MGWPMDYYVDRVVREGTPKLMGARADLILVDDALTASSTINAMSATDVKQWYRDVITRNQATTPSARVGILTPDEIRRLTLGRSDRPGVTRREARLLRKAGIKCVRVAKRGFVAPPWAAAIMDGATSMQLAIRAARAAISKVLRDAIVCLISAPARDHEIAAYLDSVEA